MEVRASIAANSTPILPGARTAAGTSGPAQADRTAAQQPGATPASDADVKSALDKVNRLVNEVNDSLHFQYHKETNQLVVRIVDNATGTVIKQYPPEEFLDLMAAISDFIGIILDKKG